KSETSNFIEYLRIYNPKISLVVHQYLGNDIEDYISRPQYRRSEWRKLIGEYSELVNFIEVFLYVSTIGPLHFGNIIAAYENQKLVNQHLSDLQALHEKIYSTNAKLFFILCPYISNNDVLERSQNYI